MDFFTGFEKQSEKKERRGSEFKRHARNALVGVGALGLRDLGTMAGQNAGWVINGLNEVPTNTGEMDRFQAAMKSRHKLQHVDVEYAGRSGSFQHKTNKIITGPSIGTLAHELGHASNFNNGLLRGQKRYAVYGLSRKLTKPTALASTLTAATSDNEKVRKAAIAAPLVAAAPHLYEEGLATGKGLNAIRKTFGVRRAIREAIPLAGAFGTYAAAPLAASGAAYLAHKWHKNKESRSTVKQAAFLDGFEKAASPIGVSR